MPIFSEELDLGGWWESLPEAARLTIKFVGFIALAILTSYL
jgi:hypothetical protein